MISLECFKTDHLKCLQCLRPKYVQLNVVRQHSLRVSILPKYHHLVTLI
jgi:hypothetical protein